MKSSFFMGRMSSDERHGASRRYRARSPGGSARALTMRVLLIASLLACCLTGCHERAGEAAIDGNAAAQQRPPARGESLAADSAITVTDRLDRQISFTLPPQRIVSLTPSITEVLFGIGAGDRIVGATSHCNYPPAAEELPRVGGGTLESLNQEKIFALQPDLVLCKWDNHEPLLRNLERLGVPVLALGPETLAELYEETRMLGRVTGNSTEAETTVESMQQRVAAVVQRIPPGYGPRVFYQVWDNPLMTAGPNSYIGELLKLAGAQNVFVGTTVRYPKVNPEAVVAGDPEVILAPETHGKPVTIESILTRPGWSHVSAIRDKRVYLINRDTISRCGPRLVDALEQIFSVLYPQEFGESGSARPPRSYGFDFTLPPGGSRSEPQRVFAGRAVCEIASVLRDAPPQRLVPRLRPSRREGEVSKYLLNIDLKTARPPLGEGL